MLRSTSLTAYEIILSPVDTYFNTAEYLCIVCSSSSDVVDILCKLKHWDSEYFYSHYLYKIREVGYRVYIND